MTGAPLAGIRVVEIAGMGPAPYCATLLADLGADIIRIDRPGPDTFPDPAMDVLSRSRRSIALNLKEPEAVEIALALIANADVLLEGFRPGVLERLGLGPAACHARNPRLVYGRMTGWGQDGPWSQMAGHDLTYLAITGALHAIGRDGEAPVPPLNLVGDFGGGGTFLALGVVAALLTARTTGVGDVIDASIVDGTASLLGMIRSYRAEGTWLDRRESNMLDGGAPYYACYECSDGEYVAIAAIELRFWTVLLQRIGHEGDPALGQRDDRARWPEVRARLAAIFATHPRDHWVELCAGSDACLAPVLSLDESLNHEHNVAREVFVDVGSVAHPAPAPRFANASTVQPRCAPWVGQHTREVLAELGLAAQAHELEERGVIVTPRRAPNSHS